MRVIFTGAHGALGKKYISMFPDVIPVSVRYEAMADLEKSLGNADVLIHAAANLTPKSIDDAIKDNAILPLDILGMAEKLNPNIHIIMISTMSILDEGGSPRKMRDMTFYAASKYIMEELGTKVTKNPLTIVRFSSLFYEDPSRDGLSRMVYTACKSDNIAASDCRRDFLPLSAACKWLNKLCGNKKWFNRTINLASGRSVNMIDVAHHLVKKYGVSFHHVSLPDYVGICYKFNADDPQSLEQISFDIYKLVDEYYDKIKREGSNEQAARE